MKKFVQTLLFLTMFILSATATFATVPAKELNLLWSVGAAGTGDGAIFNASYGPKGIAIGVGGTIFAADPGNNRILVLDSNGTYITKFGVGGTGPGQFNRPNGVAVDSSGNVFVSDSSNHRIQKFNSLLAWVWTVGGVTSGTTDTKFNVPAGISLDTGGNLYVVDSSNHRIMKFDTNGNFITKYSHRGTGDGFLYYPSAITVDSSGNMYIVDNTNYRIQKWNSSGVFQMKLGSSGTGPGQFSYGYGIAVDSDSNIYFADTSNSRIQKFNSNGKFVTQYNTTMTSVFSVAIDQSGNLYAGDKVPKIKKFDFTSTPIYQVTNLAGNLDISNASTGLTYNSTNVFGATGTVTARLKTSTGIPISEFSVAFSGDLDWSNVSGDSDQVFGKSFVNNLVGASGVGSTHTLYIPIPNGRTSNSVFICPSASSLADVNLSCPDGVNRGTGSYTESFGNIVVSQVNNLGDNNYYWKITGMTGSGGLASDIVSFSGSGVGDTASPYLITTCSQLQEMADNTTAHYKISNDIDCAETTGWNAGAGFVSIGTTARPFTGSLDGQHFTISNLYINRSTDYIGLFGHAVNATFSNINLSNLNYQIAQGVVRRTSSYAGGIVSSMQNSSISDCSTTGQIVQSYAGEANLVGGIVGEASGTITNTATSVNITIDNGGEYMFDIGGLVGRTMDTTTISDSHSTGSVHTSVNSYDIGGFIGWQLGDTIINNCYSSGEVHVGVGFTDRGDNYDIGGFIGNMGSDYNYLSVGLREINNSYSTGNVIADGSDNYDVGGFVGTAYERSTISNSYATGNVTGGINNVAVAGFVGLTRNRSDDGGANPVIRLSHATGQVATDFDSYNVGGFVGEHRRGTITESYSTGNVSSGSIGNEMEYTGSVGGFAGYMTTATSIISKSYSTGNVDTFGEAQSVGGFIGYIGYGGTIEECYSLGAYVNAYAEIGGFTGGTRANVAPGILIKNSYSRTAPTARFIDPSDPTGIYMKTSGFVGSMGAFTTIENSYSTGKPSNMTNSLPSISTTLSGSIVYTDTSITVADATGIVPGGYLILDVYTGTPFSTTLTSAVAVGAEYINVADASGFVPGNNITFEKGVVGKEETKQIYQKVGNQLRMYANSWNRPSYTHDINTSVTLVPPDLSEIVLVRGVTGNTLTVTRAMGQTSSNDHASGANVANYLIPASTNVGIGGFALFDTGVTGTVTNSYWDTDISQWNSSDAGTGLSTSQMKSQESYNNWDFNNIWHLSLDVNDGYPAFTAGTPYPTSTPTNTPTPAPTNTPTPTPTPGPPCSQHRDGTDWCSNDVGPAMTVDHDVNNWSECLAWCDANMNSTDLPLCQFNADGPRNCWIKRAPGYVEGVSNGDVNSCTWTSGVPPYGAWHVSFIAPNCSTPTPTPTPAPLNQISNLDTSLDAHLYPTSSSPFTVGNRIETGDPDGSNSSNETVAILNSANRSLLATINTDMSSHSLDWSNLVVESSLLPNKVMIKSLGASGVSGLDGSLGTADIYLSPSAPWNSKTLSDLGTQLWGKAVQIDSNNNIVTVGYDSSHVYAYIWNNPTTFSSETYDHKVQISTNYLPENGYSNSSASVRKLGNNKFLVTWRSYDYSLPDWLILAKIIDSDGNVITGDIVLSETVNNIYDPVASNISDGRLMTTWYERNNGVEIAYGQMLDVGGTKIGSTFEVSDSINHSAEEPDVAALSNGKYVFTYYDGNAEQVYYRIWDPNTSDFTSPPVKIEIGAVDYAGYYQSIAPDDAGGFAILFGGYYDDGVDYYDRTYLQIFDQNQTPILNSISEMTLSNNTDTQWYWDALGIAYYNGIYHTTWDTYYNNGTNRLNGVVYQKVSKAGLKYPVIKVAELTTGAIYSSLLDLDKNGVPVLIYQERGVDYNWYLKGFYGLVSDQVMNYVGYCPDATGISEVGPSCSNIQYKQLGDAGLTNSLPLQSDTIYLKLSGVNSGGAFLSVPPAIQFQNFSQNQSIGSSVSLDWLDLGNQSNGTISFYYDLDSSGYDGTQFATGYQGSSVTNTATIDTSSIPAGTYWLYAEINDSVNPPSKTYAPYSVEKLFEASPTPTSTPTPTNTPSPTNTPTSTPTNTPILTNTPTPTGTISPTTIPSPTPTGNSSLTPTTPPASTPTPSNNNNNNNNNGNNNSQNGPGSDASVKSGFPNCDKVVTKGIPDLFQVQTNNTTATLSFTSPQLPFTSFYIAYSRNLKNWEYGTEYDHGYSSGVLTHTINILHPNTKYYFMMRAGNGCATGDWSNIIQATTTNSSNKYKTFLCQPSKLLAKLSN